MDIVNIKTGREKLDYALFDPQGDEMSEEEVQRMLQMVFVKYNQSKFSEIEDAVSSGDTKLAHRLVHTLRGNAGQVGKTALFNVAEKIEILFRDEKLPIPEETMNTLKNELDLALEEFSPLLDETKETDGAISVGDMQGALDTALKGGILIIDDNAANVRVLSSILKPGYAVYESESGPNAVSAAAELLPDLILMEVLMSGMDGFAMLSALKNSAATKEIPVVFITELDDARAEEKALSMGAADYITRPFSPTVVRLRVKNQVHIGRLRRDVESALTTARAASRAKSDFLANMSNGLQMLMNAEFLRNIGHELKTSLTRIHTSITNAADILDYGMDRDEMLESLEDAGQEIMKMADLINGEISRFAGEDSMDG